MWQPIGVVVASGIAYGTTAKYRCGPDLPSCRAVNEGEACCTVESNMGWRYNLIVLGGMTLFIFFLRYFVFRFHESPKFLLSRGREAEAIAVLHRIAKFNKAPPPTLTMEMFRAIDIADGVEPIEQITEVPPENEAGLKGPKKMLARAKRMVGLGPKRVGGPSRAAKNKAVFKNAGREVTRLKKIFTNKLSCFIFILLGITYMGDYWSFSKCGRYSKHLRQTLIFYLYLLQILRVTFCHSSCCVIMSRLAEEPSATLTNNTSSSMPRAYWERSWHLSPSRCRWSGANGRLSSLPSARAFPWPCTPKCAILLATSA